jgi:hypothetical protein
MTASIRVEHRNLSTGSRRVVALPQGFLEALASMPKPMLKLDAKRHAKRGRPMSFRPLFQEFASMQNPQVVSIFQAFLPASNKSTKRIPFNDR